MIREGTRAGLEPEQVSPTTALKMQNRAHTVAKWISIRTVPVLSAIWGLSTEGTYVMKTHIIQTTLKL